MSAVRVLEVNGPDTLGVFLHYITLLLLYFSKGSDQLPPPPLSYCRVATEFNIRL